MHEIPLAAEKLFQIGFLPITNTLIVSWMIVIALCIFGFLAGKNVKMVPKGIQNVAEGLLEPLYNIVEDLAHSKTNAFFPIVATFFIYILAANLFGLFPGFGTIGFWEEHEQKIAEQSTPERIKGGEAQKTAELQVTEPSPLSSEPDILAEEPKVEEHETVVPEGEEAVKDSQVKQEENAGETAKEHQEESEKVFIPFLRSLNADLNMTLGLGFLSILITHIYAIKYLGIFGYLSKWFSLNPIFLFVGLLELVGEFTKMLSLSLRLFGNIFAGEVVLSTISSLLAFLAPLPFYFLEMIVAVVQAAVFMLLTLVFMVLLSEKHEAH